MSDSYNEFENFVGFVESQWVMVLFKCGVL